MIAGRRCSAILLAALLCTLVTGCISSRRQVEDLPSEPIAFLHWEDKASEKRSKAFKAVDELPPPPPNKEDPERAEEIEIRAYLEGEKTSVLSARLAKNPGRLMLYFPATEELQQVDAAPPNSRPLAWSKDHRRLIFVSSHRDGREQIYEYNLDNELLTPLTFPPAEHPRADFDDQGRLVILRIERLRRGGRSTRSVHLANSTGRLETEVADGVDPGTLRIGPSGDRIFYEKVVPRPRRDGATTFDSFIATRSIAAGSEEEILTRGREPDLTPDGEWIVFASPSSAGYRLRRMRPDGTSRVPIGPGGTEERMPSVSPDGRYVAFIKDAGSSRRLYVRRYDGKNERVLQRGGWSEFPVW